MMEGWKVVLLGDLLKKIIGGGTPSKSKPEYWNGDILWCSVKDMQDDRFTIADTVDRITELGLKNSSANLIPKGTVITATRMGLGRAFIAETDMAINQDLKALIPNEKIDNNFLLWAIVSNRNNLENLGSGSTVMGIRLETLKSIKINLPPQKTQRKIASILSGYDDLIENNLKRIKLLEEQAQQTYEEWFVRFKFPAYENVGFDEESALPFGWEKSELGSLVSLQAKMVHPKDLPKETPYIGLEHIPRRSITLSDWETAEKVDSSKYRFKKLDILFGKIRPYFHKVGVALIDGIASSDTIILRPKKNGLHGLILQTVFSNHFVDSATQSSNGTKMPRANWKVLKKYPVVIPTLDLIQKYDQLSSNVIGLIASYVYQNQLLKEARDILLPRLMSGVIDVESFETQQLETL